MSRYSLDAPKYVGWASAFLVSIALGCGDHASVSGRVAYSGKAVSDGAIRFFPTGGTAGFGAEAKIQDGGYAFLANAELTPGRYRVEIRATKSTGKIAMPNEDLPDTSPPEEFRYEYIPDQYNDRSTLEITLTAGENRHDFDLQRDQEWETQRQKDFPEFLREVIKKDN